MTTVERIAIRWLAAISSAGAAAIAVANQAGVDAVGSDFMLIALIAIAFVQALVLSLTTESGQKLLGTSK